MIKDCKFEVWNYKYNQFTPCQVIEKVDSKFVRLHSYAWKENRETGEKEVVSEFDQFTYLQGIKNIGEWRFDILKLFSPGTMIQTKGYRLIIDRAKFDKEENIRVYYRYLECDENLEREIKSKSSAWSWINSYGAQWKR